MAGILYIHQGAFDRVNTSLLKHILERWLGESTLSKGHKDSRYWEYGEDHGCESREGQSRADWKYE